MSDSTPDNTTVRLEAIALVQAFVDRADLDDAARVIRELIAGSDADAVHLLISLSGITAGMVDQFAPTLNLESSDYLARLRQWVITDLGGAS